MTRVEGRTLLAEWFRQWRLPLRRFLLRRRSVPSADLDDVAQEVFLRLMRYESTALVECPQAYLYKIAANVAAEWSIRARYSKRHEPEWLADLVAEDQPEDHTERDLIQAEVARALSTLNPRQQEVLKLIFSEALGHAQIAQQLGTTPRSVKRIVTKSYHRLRHELSPELLGTVARGSE
jgi:RNA polymerase sigma factor (sigma-70 family)